MVHSVFSSSSWVVGAGTENNLNLFVEKEINLMLFSKSYLRHKAVNVDYLFSYWHKLLGWKCYVLFFLTMSSILVPLSAPPHPFPDTTPHCRLTGGRHRRDTQGKGEGLTSWGWSSACRRDAFKSSWLQNVTFFGNFSICNPTYQTHFHLCFAKRALVGRKHDPAGKLVNLPTPRCHPWCWEPALHPRLTHCEGWGVLEKHFELRAAGRKWTHS